MLSFEIRICQETCLDCSEAGVRCRQENASDVNHVSWVDLSGQAAIAVDGQGSGNVSDRHLIGHLLDLDLLEWHELGSSC